MREVAALRGLDELGETVWFAFLAGPWFPFFHFPKILVFGNTRPFERVTYIAVSPAGGNGIETERRS